MGNFTFNRSEKGEWVLGGDLTIENAARIRAKISEEIERADLIALKFGESISADVSFLQILCSAHKTAAGMKKELILDCSGSDALAAVIRDAGYLRDKGCISGLSGKCLWAAGDDND